MAEAPSGTPFFKKEDEGDDEVKVEKKVEDKDENELFVSKSEDDDDEDPDDEDPKLFDDKDPDKKKGPPETIKYDRFAKVIGQRNDLRTKMETIEGRLEVATELNKAFSDEYSKFEDPTAQLLEDASFMASMEEVLKVDPSYMALVTAVEAYRETGKVPSMTDPSKTTDPKTDPKPDLKPDPNVARLVEREDRRSIDEALKANGVKESFRGVVADYMIGDNDIELGSMSAREIVAYTKTFIDKRGFTKDEVLAPVEKTEENPKTSGGTTKAATEDIPTDDQGRPLDKEGKPPAVPKDRNEWNKQRAARIKSLVG